MSKSHGFPSSGSIVLKSIAKPGSNPNRDAYALIRGWEYISLTSFPSDIKPICFNISVNSSILAESASRNARSEFMESISSSSTGIGVFVASSAFLLGVTTGGGTLAVGSAVDEDDALGCITTFQRFESFWAVPVVLLDGSLLA